MNRAAARSVDDLWAAIAEAIERFPPAECANFFANTGHEPHRSENALEHRFELLEPLLAGWD